VVQRRMPAEAAAAAHELFAALRDFDTRAVQLIWVEQPPDDAAWDAVADRLRRAAAGSGAPRNLECPWVLLQSRHVPAAVPPRWRPRC